MAIRFGRLKQLLSAYLQGDSALFRGNNDAALEVLVNDALVKIGRIAYPLEMLTNDPDADRICQVCEGWFVEKPNFVASSDDSLIGIDSALEKALAYCIAADTVSSKPDMNRRGMYDNKLAQEITEYMHNLYERFDSAPDDIDTSGYTDSSVKYLLDAYGLRLFYLKRYLPGVGVSYLWDDTFFALVDDYLGGLRDVDLTQSERKAINAFIDYQDGNLPSGTEPYVALDTRFTEAIRWD